MRTVALVVALAATLHAAPCRAQTDDALAAARRLFTEAVADEQGRRYEVALDKFRRVLAVRETANVRYRVATCLEAMGHNAEAVASFEAAMRLGAQDPASSEVVVAARARAAHLEPLVSRLAIELPPDAPAGAEIRLDDAPVEPFALAASIPLEPGHHTVRASAPGRTPFETVVDLPPGGRVSISVTLPVPGQPQPASPGAPAAPSPAATGSLPAAAPPAADAGDGRAVAAWVAIGLGGVLATGSVIALVLRASNLQTLDRDCTTSPSGTLACPSWAKSEVNAAHDAAKVEGPLGIGLGAGALAAVGIGAWLFASASRSSTSGWTAAPVLMARGGGLAVQGLLP